MRQINKPVLVCLGLILVIATAVVASIAQESEPKAGIPPGTTRAEGNNRTPESHNAQVRQEISGLEDKLGSLKREINDLPEGRDPVLLVEEYLSTALHAVYYAKTLTTRLDGGDGSLNLEGLVDAGYLKAWPENPVDAWRPMKVLAPSDGFSEGDLCIDYCPPAFYSNWVGKGLQPLSFQLYVYGITPSQGAFKEVSVLGWNKKWATVPHDVLYGLTFSASPASEPKYFYNPETGEYYTKD